MKKSSAPLFDYCNESLTKRKYGRTSHGGVNSEGKRKEYRPLAEKKWIHLTLKSAKAKGAWSFLAPKNRKIINDTLKSKAKKWGVEIAEVVNVGNHLHIKLRFKYREGFQNFLRSVTAVIARKITNVRRGYKITGEKLTAVLKTPSSQLNSESTTAQQNSRNKAENKSSAKANTTLMPKATAAAKLKATPKPPEKFWQGLAFTRVIRTRFEELQLKGYFQANRVQAEHGEEAREEYLNKFNEWAQSLRGDKVQSTA